jgi:hypothetical protein
MIARHESEKKKEKMKKKRQRGEGRHGGLEPERKIAHTRRKKAPYTHSKDEER